MAEVWGELTLMTHMLLLLRGFLVWPLHYLLAAMYFPARDEQNVPRCLDLLMHLSRSPVHGGALYLSHKLSFHGSSVSFRHSAFRSHSVNYVNRNLAEFLSTLSSLDGRERECNKR